jgi:hypothetical protein
LWRKIEDHDWNWRFLLQIHHDSWLDSLDWTSMKTWTP